MKKLVRRKKFSKRISRHGNHNVYMKKCQRHKLPVKRCRDKLSTDVNERKKRIEKLRRENTKLEGTIEELKKNIILLNELLIRSELSGEHKIQIEQILTDFEE